MRRIVVVIVLILVLADILPTCLAYDVFETQYDSLDISELEDSLPTSAREQIGGIEIGKGLSLDDGLRELMSSGLGQINGLIKNSLRSISVLIVIVLICGLAQTLYDNSGSSSVTNYIPLVGALTISVAVSADVHSLIGLGREMFISLDIFSKGLLGTLAAATSFTGRPVSSSARYLATIFFSDVLMTLINRILIPIVYAYIATVTANAAIGENVLGRMASFLKWMSSSILAFVMAAYIAYLTVTGFVTGSVDAAAVKTTKLVLTNIIPVVGKVLSDATETVLASAGILRNSVRIFGMLGVLAICLIPFMRLGIHYLVFKMAAAVSAPLSDKRLSDLLDNLAGAFGLIMGMTGASALLILISIVSAISAFG